MANRDKQIKGKEYMHTISRVTKFTSVFLHCYIHRRINLYETSTRISRKVRWQSMQAAEKSIWIEISFKAVEYSTERISPKKKIQGERSSLPVMIWSTSK